MLGDPASALEELERLTPASRSCREVLELEWGIHAERADWSAAAAVAGRLVEQAPDQTFGWIHRAYAVRRQAGGGLDQAWVLLRPALERFPQNPIVAYNLACYAAQMNQMEEAWSLFQRALAVAPKRAELLAMALADHDLKPLWPRICSATQP